MERSFQVTVEVYKLNIFRPPRVNQFYIHALLFGGYARFVPLDKISFYGYWKTLPSSSSPMLHIAWNFFLLCNGICYSRRGDVVRELLLGYPGTFIERTRKSFPNPTTQPWKLDRQALFSDVPEYQNCTGVVISSMNYSTYLSVSIISSYWNLSKPHIERDSFVENVILGNNKNITFHSCHKEETSAHVCTITFSVKGTASKNRVQTVATTAI